MYKEVTNITVFTDHTIKFTFPIPIDRMKAAVTLSQNGSVVLEYTDESPCLSKLENELTLSLTPTDTGKFSPAGPNAFAVAQINLLYEGVRHATRPVRIPVYSNLKAEVME